LESVLSALSGLSPESLLADPRRVEGPIYLVLLGVEGTGCIVGSSSAMAAGRDGWAGSVSS
jgi:hypothetical protein